MQPGETITPGTQPTPEQTPEQQAAPAVAPTPQPVVEQVPETPAPPTEAIAAQPAYEQIQAPAAPTEVSGWQYTDGSNDVPGAADTFSDVQPVKWTASEYIAHQKGLGWFVLLGLILFVVIAVVYLFTRDILASVLVGIAGLSFGIFAARPPRVLNYAVDNHGIQIEQKFYPYQEFRSFSVLEDGPLPAVLLMPLKKFLPPITVFFAPEEADSILDMLASYLPHEERQLDIIDRLMSRIRF